MFPQTLSQTAAVLVFMNKLINSLLELLDKKYKIKCATNYQLQNIPQPYSGCQDWHFQGFLHKIRGRGDGAFCLKSVTRTLQ